jgi:hypothetical protein
MPEPVEPAPLTEKEEAEWRAEFERRGRGEIHAAIYSGAGIYPDRKRGLAVRWLREKEKSEEKRATKTYSYVKWTWDAALAVVILTFITLLVVLGVIKL